MLVSAIRLLGFINRALCVIALILLITGAAGLAWFGAHGQKLLSVQTASMVPTFRPGDTVIVQPITTQHLKIGQVISYRSPRDHRVIITHRLIAINWRTQQLTTAGDALHSSDPSFSSHLVVGQAIAVAPQFGRLLDILHQPLGLISIIYIPAVLIIAAETVHVWHHSGWLIYRLDR